MQEIVKVWLEDIEKAIAEINDFLPPSKNFLEFQKDLKTLPLLKEQIKKIKAEN